MASFQPEVSLTLSPTDILEGMDEAFYAIDHEWCFLYVNRGAEQFWKCRRDELLGHSMLEVFPAFGGSLSYRAHERAFATGERERVEVISSVTKLPVELHLRPAPWGLAVFFRDISDRIQTERALRERSELLKLAEETAEIGIWDIDIATNTVRGTPQFFRLMGLPPSDEPIPLEVTRSLRIGDDRVRVIGGFRAAIEQGHDSYDSEYRITRPSDGEVRWIYGRGRVIRDRDGDVLRYAGVDMDITARKAGEVAASRLASIVESSDDAIISKDLDGIITSWNAGAERLYGFTSEEAIGKPITLIIPDDRQHEEPTILGRIRSGQRVDHYETVRRRKDGTLVDISLTVSPLRDAAGAIIGASKIARDISERRRTEEMERLLLREMNHRIKNLFSLAGGVVPLSARSTNDPAELAGNIRERLNALARAHALTLRPSGELQETDSALDLVALLQAILAPYEAPGENKNIFLQGPSVSIGRRALSNLALLFYEFATNAAKYGALGVGGGRVEVVWQIQDDTLEMTWRESGGPRLEEPPTAEGFGTGFTERALTNALRGRLHREYAVEGIILRLAIPMESLTD